MPKAVAYADETVIAESDNTVIVEGNHYFPVEDVHMDKLEENDFHTTCHWKGQASYYNVKGDERTFENAAFIYKEPKTEQAQVVDKRIAFWQGIRVEEK